MNDKLIQLGLTLSTALAIVSIPCLTLSTLAQNQDPANEGYQSNEQDSLYGEGISGINPLDLIHRAKLNNGRNAEEFDRDSQNTLNDSASEFKRLQQERILQQNSPSPAQPAEPIKK
jgi:hypothetical protein